MTTPPEGRAEAAETLDAATEIERLRRRLEREHKARIEAETISEYATRELYTKQEDLLLLETITAAANEARTPKRALQVALDVVCEHTGWPLGHVFLLADGDQPMLEPTDVWHVRDRQRFQPFRDATKASRFGPGEGLPGRVLECAEPLWLPDVRPDPRFPRSDVAAQVGLAAAFGVPVMAEREVLGVLEFFTDATVEPDEGLLGVMSHVGTQLGRALERARAAEEVDRTRAALQEHINAMTTFTVTCDRDGAIRTFNEVALVASGLPREEFTGTKLWAGEWFAFDPAVGERVEDRFRRAVEGEFVIWDEDLLIADGSQLVINMNLTPIFNDDGEVSYIVGEGRDITAQKEIESELRVYRTQLEELVDERTRALKAANRELEAFSYSVSHDLRAPLRSLDGFSTALVEDFGDSLDEEGLEYLERIRGASQRMGLLIDDVLQLSRISRRELKQEPVDLATLAGTVVEELREREPNRAVAVTIAEGVQPTGDAGLLRLVLANLIGNAWKFTAQTEHARIEFGSEERDGESVYFVRDNGAGFDMEYVDKLFGPFQRLHATHEFEGSGIGLATVQRIVQRHGGRAWAEGAVDKGATFYFTLGRVPVSAG